MKQVTAVEWLQAEIDNKDMGEIPMWVYEFIEQAKAMEKEQIIISWHNGYENQSPMIDENNCGQLYYNKQFKQDNL
jgi:tetrahydromethanopterin S-methyltransferase subunit A